MSPLPPTKWTSRVLRILIVALTAGVTVLAYDLYKVIIVSKTILAHSGMTTTWTKTSWFLLKYYRFVSLVLIGVGVAYCVLRAESLARDVHLDLLSDLVKEQPSPSRAAVWNYSTRISLQIILWPLIAFSGLITFSYYVQRPLLSWP